MSGQRHCWSPGRRGRCSDTQASGTRLVQALDAPVLQTVEQLPNVVQFFAAQLTVVAEQVIDVPQDHPRERPFATLVSRAAAGGTAGGSADDPDSSIFLDAALTLQFRMVVVEQTVDIPAPRSGARRPQGFLPEQSATALGVQIIVFQQRLPSRTLTIQVPGGSLHGLPVSGSSSSSAASRDVRGGRFSRTFPQNKKSATQPPRSPSALPPHSSPWTPAAYDASMVLEEEEEEEEDEPAIEYVECEGLGGGE